MNGQVVAYFPTGTIPFGHACGWPDAHTSWNGNSHSWILKNGKQIRPPTDVHQDCMQRHAKLMNSSRVRFIIFPAHNDNTHKMLDIDNGRLRRLAYLIGGIGYIQYQKSIAWISHKKQTSLAWSHQGSDRELDFTIPWRMCMWQSSRKLTPSALEQNATPILSDQVQAQRQQQRLHTLSANNDPIDTIPDGACPSALPLLLTRLGTYQVDNNNIIYELIRSTLSNTFNLAEVHKTWKVHHLQLIGIPLIGLGTIPNKTTSTCHLCDTTWRHMFLIHANDKLAPLAHQQLLQHVMTREALRRTGQKENDKEATATIQQCTEAWDTTLKTRGQPDKTPLNNHLVPLATALYKWGACVCLLCATPILADIQQQKTHHCQSDNRSNSPNPHQRILPISSPPTPQETKTLSQTTSTPPRAQQTPQSPKVSNSSRTLRSRTSSFSDDQTRQPPSNIRTRHFRQGLIATV